MAIIPNRLLLQRLVSEEKKEKGIPAYQIASDCGMHPNILSGICRGTMNPNDDQVAALEKYFGVDRIRLFPSEYGGR